MTPTPSAATSAAAPAPARPPNENAACRPVKIGFGSRRSTVRPCTFCDTSRKPFEKPIKASPPASTGSDSANATGTSPSAQPQRPTITRVRLP